VRQAVFKSGPFKVAIKGYFGCFEVNKKNQLSEHLLSVFLQEVFLVGLIMAVLSGQKGIILPFLESKFNLNFLSIFYVFFYRK
jgi:hypothetical protein